MSEMFASFHADVERLGAAVAALEAAAARTGEVGKITASVEASPREMDLERRLAEAERELVSLRANTGASAARKTVTASTVQLQAKQGIEAGESMDVRTLDAALEGMSVEQRIAVKSQMLRAGTLTL